MLLDFICDQFDTGSFVTKNALDESPIEEPRRLDFRLEADDLKAVEAAGRRINDTAADLDVKTFAFENYGKNVPKSAHLSPDSFIQLALQLSFYRIHRSHPPTYETGEFYSVIVLWRCRCSSSKHKWFKGH